MQFIQLKQTPESRGQHYWMPTETSHVEKFLPCQFNHKMADVAPTAAPYWT